MLYGKPPRSVAMKRKLYLLALSLIVIFSIAFYQRSLDTISGNSFLSQYFSYLQSSDRGLNSEFEEDNKFDNIENVPYFYFEKEQRLKRQNQGCARFPNFFDLKFNNNYWQVQKTSKGTFYLFNAFLDKRKNPVVRLIGLYNEYLPKQAFYCQFWYSTQSTPQITQSKILFWMFREGWGADFKGWNQPYLITCPLPMNITELPVSVSLVEYPCELATNNMKIINRNIENKKKFVVCVKGLEFFQEDISARLAEWIELLNILGAEKIQLYEFHVHPKTKRLLNYYKKKGIVDVIPLSLAGDYSNHPNFQHMFLKTRITERRLQEVIPFNDCLYRHLDEFNFAVLLDVDEVILPVEGTWMNLINTLQKTVITASYLARNIYFLDSHLHNHKWFEDIPKQMHMLQHVYRAKNYTNPGEYVKGFHDINNVLVLHNHFPIACLHGCTHNQISTALAHLQHYRSDCVEDVQDCESLKENSVLDTRIWNYKEELINKVKNVFLNLGYDFK